ncbi:MAG: ATP-binding cassette domain-containing protein [Comamonadaceae bacterium]|nr:ATP-binding cassette domain-containing protein [Comamonadaceae bacterium]
MRLNDEDISGPAGALPHRHPAPDLRLRLPAVQPDQGPLGAGKRHAARLSAGPATGAACRSGPKTCLPICGLAHRRDARVEWLSGGEQQRVAICRALINDPQVVIADEPTANLDTALAREFMGILEMLKTQGKTVLLTSHDPLVVESSLVDTRDRPARRPRGRSQLKQTIGHAVPARHHRPAARLERERADAAGERPVRPGPDPPLGHPQRLRAPARAWSGAPTSCPPCSPSSSPPSWWRCCCSSSTPTRCRSMFVGAMCAVGTLNVNAFGFPALIAQMVVFFLASSWLVVNHVDTRARDYPLTRIKYALLLAILPFVIAAFALQLAVLSRPQGERHHLLLRQPVLQRQQDAWRPRRRPSRRCRAWRRSTPPLPWPS